MTLRPWVTKARLSDVQPGDVGDRAERDEVEQIDQLRLFSPIEKAARPQLADECDAEQEGHADGGEMAVGRRPTRPRPAGSD